jgi:hypothetical protein
MKLLNRLRELRNELHPEWMIEEINNNQHLETIGIGATTIGDIARLHVVHFNLENLIVDGLNSDGQHNQY